MAKEGGLAFPAFNRKSDFRGDTISDQVLNRAGFAGQCLVDQLIRSFTAHRFATALRGLL